MKTLLVFILTISATLAQTNPLSELRQIVRQASGRPVIIFDLDDTLFDSRSRKMIIQQEFSSSSIIQKIFPEEAELLAGMELDQVEYSVVDTMKNLGIADKKFINLAKSYWSKTFFTNEYVAQDEAIEGAVSYVHSVRRDGAFVVYLTGRDETMRAGTEASLRHRGFPMGKNTKLILKPNKKMDDTDFKQREFSKISKIGKVVAAFENEPANLNAMAKAFRGAKMFFLDTLHSAKPAKPLKSAHFIKDYLY